VDHGEHEERVDKYGRRGGQDTRYGAGEGL